MGAGVGAIFRAPLGGAMMAAEALYRDDFEADAILLSLISSIVAFAVYGAWYDYTPIFAVRRDSPSPTRRSCRTTSPWGSPAGCSVSSTRAGWRGRGRFSRDSPARAG